jgi:elongation factor G
MARDIAHLIAIAIEAQSRDDQQRLLLILEMMAAVDACVGMSADPETGQAVLKGPDAYFLESVVGRLRRDLGLAIRVGRPQVAYRETPSLACEIDYTHREQWGGSGQFARVKIAFEPAASGSGYHFENRIVGQTVPKEFVPGVEKGLAAARQSGSVAGFPVIDFKAILLDGAYHDVDSSPIAFEIAARAAFKAGMRKAECQLLEPIMKAEIAVPLGFSEEIVRDLNERRTRHQGLETRRNFEIIHVLVPLANMFGYINTLREITHRRGTFGMAFDHYAPVPQRPDDDPFRPAVGMRA